MKTHLYIVFIFFQAISNLNAQANKTVKAAPNIIGSVGNQATVSSITYAWTVGEPIVFTGVEASGFLTQGFHQPMICKATSTIVALNQTSCTLPYSLTATTGFDRYLWKIGKATIVNAGGAIYYPVANGNHSVTVMDSTGCMLASSSVLVDLSAKNIVPTITAYGPSASKDTMLVCSDAFTYQWYVITPSDGVHRAIVGQINKSYVPLYNGTYYVQINTDEYCVSYSAYYAVNNAGYIPINKDDFENTDSTISIVGRHRFIADNLKVYPIPSKDKINIEYESADNNTVLFNVYDLKGILIDSRRMKSFDGRMNWVYENDNLPTGKYMLRVIDGDRKYDKNIIFE